VAKIKHKLYDVFDGRVGVHGKQAYMCGHCTVQCIQVNRLTCVVTVLCSIYSNTTV